MADVNSYVSLTPRQLECLRWVAKGKSSTDIAGILGVSPDTVDEHVQNACGRLGVRSRFQAVLICVRAGVIEN